jgi:uncharacterized protein YecT (DUF1311 family)
MVKHVLICSLLASTPAWAGPSAKYSRTFDACMDKSGGVTVEMLNCISAETKVQDQRLNKNYKELMAQLSAARRKELTEVQRAWLKFRDLNCTFYADPEAGSIATVSSNDCVLAMTALRADELEDLKPPE